MKALYWTINKLRENPPPLLLGDFNAHHPYWYGEDANKLGKELFEYLVDKDFTIMNIEEPTRKESRIDLTIVSNVLTAKVTN